MPLFAVMEQLARSSKSRGTEAEAGAVRPGVCQALGISLADFVRRFEAALT
jgi:hypothetical protein